LPQPFPGEIIGIDLVLARLVVNPKRVKNAARVRLAHAEILVESIGRAGVATVRLATYSIPSRTFLNKKIALGAVHSA
jgi:hypothetical protein